MFSSIVVAPFIRAHFPLATPRNGRSGFLTISDPCFYDGKPSASRLDRLVAAGAAMRLPRSALCELRTRADAIELCQHDGRPLSTPIISDTVPPPPPRPDARSDALQNRYATNRALRPSTSDRGKPTENEHSTRVGGPWVSGCVPPKRFPAGWRPVFACRNPTAFSQAYRDVAQFCSVRTARLCDEVFAARH